MMQHLLSFLTPSQQAAAFVAAPFVLLAIAFGLGMSVVWVMDRPARVVARKNGGR